jgi:hypothetical protein
MKDARAAVQNALKALSSIKGVDDVEVTTTESTSNQ